MEPGDRGHGFMYSTNHCSLNSFHFFSFQLIIRRMAYRKNGYSKVMAWKSDSKKELKRTRHRWKTNIKVVLR